MKTIRIPRDFPVRPLRPSNKTKGRATCGACGLSWDDAKCTSWTPAPSGRCPFEYFHVDDGPEHTPTPWSVGEVIGRGNTQISAMVNGKPIGICSTYRVGIETDPEADAAFIVRAVNCHEELLDILKTLKANLPEMDDSETPVSGTDAVDVLSMVWKRVEIAIAKAEVR